MVIDPELGIDIVNLGLVYKVDVDDEGLCTVEMTLTSMGCPLGPQIIEQVKSVLAEIPEISDTEVMIVWSPPWNKRYDVSLCQNSFRHRIIERIATHCFEK